MTILTRHGCVYRAQGMAARSDETATLARPVGQQPGGVSHAPEWNLDDRLTLRRQHRELERQIHGRGR